MYKSELRKIFLEKRKELSAEEIYKQSAKICDALFANFDFSRINYLHCFLSIEKFNEIDTSLIIEKIRKDFPHTKVIVPRVNREKDQLENAEFNSETILVRNSWGISEPVLKETVENKLIDAVLVPLLCFDEKGFRVGYGKGFYDKFLKECRADCLKIGLSQFPPIGKIEDIREADIPLDCCITPEKIYDWRREAV